MNLSLVGIALISQLSLAQDSFFLHGKNSQHSQGYSFRMVQQAADFIQSGELIRPVKKVWHDEKLMGHVGAPLLIGTHSFLSLLYINKCSYYLLTNFGMMFYYGAGCALDISKYCLNSIIGTQLSTNPANKGQAALSAAYASAIWSLGLGVSVAFSIAPYAIIDTYRK